MTVKISLLARNTQTSTDFTDNKTYAIDGTPGPFGDHYKRHLYQTVVRLMNPAGRRERGS